MSLSYRKRIKLGKYLSLNISKSGTSLSARLGRLSFNTAGRFAVRLFKGMSWRGAWK